MLDVSKFVSPVSTTLVDPEGHMHDLPPWSPRHASQLAREAGIPELTEAHWQIIYCLRDRHREKGLAPSARVILRELEEEYAEMGGRRYLYELFPGGPVSQGCRLAGVPMPPYTRDPSFGSSS